MCVIKYIDNVSKFKYNKNEYGSDKAFIIDLQDENDDKEEYLDEEIIKEEVWSLGCQELALDLFI